MVDVPGASAVKLPAPFGKYLLSQLIAVGGMAEVYRAKIFGASGFEKDMVVKRILPRYATNPNFVQMLIDEAKIAVSLSHGNIVPIYELGELEGSYYIAMEYVEGPTVLDVLRDAHSKKRPIVWPHCLGIAAEVARGLAYAHTRVDSSGRPLSLVHRDINPRNIVITPAGEVKVLDFGIARASTKRHQTASGVIKGTPGYMSPEQMYGKAIDHRSDIYCLGILLFELLTLRRLFPVWDVAEMRKVYEAGPIPLPSSLVPHLPREVDPVVMKALSSDVSTRYQSAAEFEEALRTAIARSGLAVTASGLAREILAIDEAPGPRAPRTQPPVEPADERALQKAIEQRSSTTMEIRAPSPVAEAQAPALARIERPQGLDALSEPQRLEHRFHEQSGGRSDGPLGASVGRSDGRSDGQAPGRTPLTQTMTLPGAPAVGDASHSFVISLADQAGRQRPALVPLAPLPAPPAMSATTANETSAQRTQVLVQNADLGWTQNIGDDAELLALAQAMGHGPGQGRRTLLAAGMALFVIVILVAAALGGEIQQMVARAMSGKKQQLGSIIVKTRPSGAEVFIDGDMKGVTNLRIKNIDINEPHELSIRPQGMDAMKLPITRADFVPGEGGEPLFLVEKDLQAKPAMQPK